MTAEITDTEELFLNDFLRIYPENQFKTDLDRAKAMIEVGNIGLMSEIYEETEDGDGTLSAILNINASKDPPSVLIIYAGQKIRLDSNSLLNRYSELELQG